MIVYDVALREALESEPWPAFIVAAAGGTIVYANPAWDRVAHEAGGPLRNEVLGTWWPGAIADLALRAWYEHLFARVLAGQEDGVVCECNTPTRCRLLSIQLDPLIGPDGVPCAVLLRARLIRDVPIAERYEVTAERGDARRYQQPSGLTLQCSCCRRVLVAGSIPPRWEMVPAYLMRSPAPVSHGLCARCGEVYYGPRGDRPGVAEEGEADAPAPRCDVLVVDDDPELREAFTEMLAEEGYRAEQAGSAAEASALLAGRPEPPRVVIVDVFMPGTSGPDFVRALRRSPALRGIEVVMVSGWAGDRGAWADLGAAAWLQKPVAPELLLATIRRLVSGERRPEA